MAGFADFLSNLGTNLNNGINNLTTSPMGQLSMQMLANSGYDPQNAGFGQRMGNALMGTVQMQQAQQAAQAKNQLSQLQSTELMQKVMDAQRQRNQEQATRDYLAAHPEALSQYPTASIMAQTGATDLSPYMKIDQSANPKKPYEYTQNNPDNTQTQFVWDASKGSYSPVSTFKPTAQQGVEATVQNNQTNQGYRGKELEVKQSMSDVAKQNAQAAQQRADALTETTNRQNQAFALKNNLAKTTLETTYNGVRNQMDKQIETVDSILNDPALGRAFGWTGQAPTAPGADAARVEAKLAQLQANSGLSGLTQLKQMGIVLTPVSDPDVRIASQSNISVSNRMSVADARAALQAYRQRLEMTRTESASNYDRMARVYDSAPTSTNHTQASQQARTPVRTGTDQSGRKVVQYSDGSIEYGN